MARMKCPRCATIVDVAPGGAPVCPNCGFGAGNAPPAAPLSTMPASAPAAAPAPDAWSGTPQMSAPPPGAAPAMQRTSGKAITSLVLGIVSFCIAIYLGLLCGIIGLVFGILGMKEVDRSNGMVKGKGMAITGVVLSILGMLVQIGLLLVFGALIFGAAGDWDELQRCAEDPEAPGCEEYQSQADGGSVPGLAGLRDAAFRLGTGSGGPGLAPAWPS